MFPKPSCWGRKRTTFQAGRSVGHTIGSTEVLKFPEISVFTLKMGLCEDQTEKSVFGSALETVQSCVKLAPLDLSPSPEILWF